MTHDSETSKAGLSPQKEWSADEWWAEKTKPSRQRNLTPLQRQQRADLLRQIRRANFGDKWTGPQPPHEWWKDKALRKHHKWQYRVKHWTRTERRELARQYARLRRERQKWEIWWVGRYSDTLTRLIFSHAPKRHVPSRNKTGDL
ncbi:hypothetical protein CHELA1G11_70051 [Hyphomicrobiales bacterium]|nr:hypothetical protein CHELA1G2_60037 [Hyphomicrobiales bacterium]CAH1696945.1 hypothetical protein CHELA1G11_70051 [Hyphomicrobiales bacterium]